ncbi:hypothetical protein JTB14_014269 [Gonioctena quinquepunctata]|nr:hypothetical protein JTB14_014269 [Gonioctena quinquepunctata]
MLTLSFSQYPHALMSVFNLQLFLLCKLINNTAGILVYYTSYLFQDDSTVLTDDGMIGNKPETRDEKEVNLDVLNCNIPADSSHYTSSDKKAPNLATYYFKHEDTDSSMDKTEQHCAMEEAEAHSTLDDSSEKECPKNLVEENNDTSTKNEEKLTYEPPTVKLREKTPNLTRPKSIPEEKIRKLVQKVEELVGADRRSLNKITRVSKWLTLERPDDSCDASGEDDEKESQTSDECDVSSATLRQFSQNTSFDELNSSNSSRQWLESISQFGDVSSSTGINNFSISESALNKMNLTPKVLDRFSTSFSTVSTTNVNINSNNSTSSTVEEISPLITEKSSPIRKKKSKLKKKAVFGKSDTHLLYSPAAQKNRAHLIKSGSFPGCSTKTTNNDRNSSNDLFTSQISIQGGYCETSTTSGGDSEEDINKKMLIFKYGGKTRYLHNGDSRDDSPGKNSLNNGEEQSSSLSEQAWDNYQENYLSEPYSESHDSDAARKLLNFGEDYRNFIDSQSDWSALSDMSPRMKRKSWSVHREEDSNSEEESLKQLINNSKDQLTFSEEIYEQIKGGLDAKLVTNEINELNLTCDRHIALHKHMSETPDELKMSQADRVLTSELLNQWRHFKMKIATMDEFRRLHKQILESKSFIESLNMPDKTKIFKQDCPVEDIHNEIDACNRLLETITGQGAKLASLNALVHRYTLENQASEDFSGSALKTEISELYELYDNARTRVADKLCQIESLLPAWKTLESRLEQLQKDLRQDEKTMHLLDASLTNGTFNDQTAVSVREVAKLLSESTVNQSYHPLGDFITEGSFSDSGISDEGSEQELGERQRRLAAIRRLVRQLEIGLSPDSKARLLMREKLNAAEEELKALQLRCRSLIVRTAACSGTSIDRLRPLPEEEPLTSSSRAIAGDGGGDPGSDPHSESWFKRLFKASLAFQLVLLTFVCLSCIFEPRLFIPRRSQIYQFLGCLEEVSEE